MPESSTAIFSDAPWTGAGAVSKRARNSGVPLGQISAAKWSVPRQTVNRMLAGYPVVERQALKAD